MLWRIPAHGSGHHGREAAGDRGPGQLTSNFSAGSSPISGRRWRPATWSSAIAWGCTGHWPPSPASPAQLAERPGTDPRYVAEWLAGQAAGGYVRYDASTGTYSMTEEQAFAMADPDGPNLPGGVPDGAGRPEGRTPDHRCLPHRPRDGLARARPGRLHRHRSVLPARYAANLVPSWLPALDGVVNKLQAGGRVADVGCGLGTSSVLLAQAYPESTHRRLRLPPAVDRPGPQACRRRRRCATAPRFEVASAQTFTGTGYDLVTTFDCLHDMGDPLAAARHIREALTPDGTWLIVEPYAGDTVADNLNPLGRMYYSFSTFLCVPNGLSQPGGYALGAQAGEAAIRQVTTDAGFTRFRRAAETPFNLIYEVRP